MTRFAVVCGTTHTAAIEGISAAGATPELMAHTPAADSEILVYGQPAFAPVTPVSPTGCPTPAIITRAIRECIGFDPVVVDAGLTGETAAPIVALDGRPGVDIREPAAVPEARGIFERAREVGTALPDEELWIGETIPGGTTTALGVLTALGEPLTVSSSLPENPVELKRRVVREGLAASRLDSGDAADEPLRAIEDVGDPVLSGILGLAVGALESGAEVTLAGGTQLLAVAACIRHRGIDAPLSLATTSFVASGATDLDRAAADLDLDLVVTNPRFERADHVSMKRYCDGEAKEGVGLGGALALYDRAGEPWDRLHERVVAVYERCLDA